MTSLVSISLPPDYWKSIKFILDAQGTHLSYMASQTSGNYKELIEFEASACNALVQNIVEELEFNSP